MTSSLAAWRLALKLAVRDLRQYKGRSALAALLIFAPVLAMAALLTGLSTTNLTAAKSNAQHLQAAAASVEFDGWAEAPAPFPAAGHRLGGTYGQPTTAQVAAQAHANVVRESRINLLVSPAKDLSAFAAVDGLQLLQTDLASKLVRPTTTLDSGRWPAKPGEVVVTRKGRLAGLPSNGAVDISTSNFGNQHPGQSLGSLTIVGTVTSSEDAELIGPSVPRLAARSMTPEFIIAGSPWPRPTVSTWESYGAEVSTRSYTTIPSDDPLGSGDKGVIVAIGTMAFVVATALLAGPAFAASATRQRRSLGLIAANGATRAVLRRIVLAQALVLGVITATVAIVVGAVGGALGGKWLYLNRVGTPVPTDVPVKWLLGLLVVSALASLVSAAVPARSAGRTNLLASLRGQVSPRVVHKRWPLIGLFGIALGTACLIAATSNRDSDNESANVLLSYVGVPLFFGGAVLAVPFVLAATGRLAAHLPVTARIAVRDVSRQRTRATASVGAVLATVSILSATSIFGASVDAYTRKDYTPVTSVGSGLYVSPATNIVNPKVEQGALAALPRIRRHVSHATPIWLANTRADVPRLTAGACHPKSTPTDPLSGASVAALEPADIAAAGFDRSTKTLLDSGGAVVVGSRTSGRPFNSQPIDVTQVKGGTLTLHDQDPSGGLPAVQQRGCRPITFKATSITQSPKHLGSLRGGFVVVSKKTLAALGIPVHLSWISIDPDHPLDMKREHQLQALTPQGMQLGVEHGYRSKLPEILGGITAGFALIVLLTTIVSTLLNDAESQADIATLAAAGAPRSMRRRIVGAHAAAIGFIGAAAGIAVGFIPGLVLARAATTPTFDEASRSAPGTFAVSWWPLVTMLLLVPLMAAVISMVFARRNPSLTRREA